MEQPFGHTFKLHLFRQRPWLTLGPGWAALAGALAGGGFALDPAHLLPLVLLWLLADPVLGALWELAAQPGAWRETRQSPLPAGTPVSVNLVPYAAPGSWGYRLARWWGRLRAREGLRLDQAGGQISVALIGGTVLALFLGLLLRPIFLPLILLSFGLALLAGPGRLFWQAAGNVLIPWAMGALLFAPLNLFSALLAVCYGLVFWGGLRLAGGDTNGERPLIMGQVAAALLLAGLREPLSAAALVLAVLWQLILRAQARPAGAWGWYLRGVQPFLVAGMMAAAWGAG